MFRYYLHYSIHIISFHFMWVTTFAQDSSVNHWETVVYEDDVWNYHIGSTEPDAHWRELTFADTSWSQGIGGIGYGDDDDNTVIGSTLSLYLRMKLNLVDTSNIETLLLHVDYDDAFVAYINDVEIARSGISGEHPAHDQVAESNHDAQMFTGGLPEEFTVNKLGFKTFLKPDSNLLSVQIHNISSTSSDLSSRVFLSLGITDTSRVYRPTPDWFVEPFVFSSSNLPIVLINTAGLSIPDEPKIMAKMKIIYNGPSSINTINDKTYNYDGDIGIEIRGAYSAMLPQKPYGFETRDALGENLNVSLLGMPEENDWILLANYNDKVFMRNTLAFHLFREMGHYAPRTEFCEVVLNDKYDGIYIFTEKIKQDKNRVNIAKLDLDDNAGDSLTGGYIFKIDYYSDNDSWVGSYSPIDNPGATVRYVYSYPDPDEITNQQKTYIKNYIDAFESVLYSSTFDDPNIGYRQFVDINSFIDYFVIGEITRNVDAYKKSAFYYKDKDNKGGLIHSGPVWDFDWAWKNLIDGCTLFNATDGSGWAYTIGGECSPSPTPSGWIVRMMQDTNFVNQLANRYHSLRKTLLSYEYLTNYIDSIHNVLNEAQERHYTRWQILGRNVGAPESDYQPDTYAGEIDKFKSWISTRLTWLDSNMPEAKEIVSSEMMAANQLVYRLFPNPGVDYIFVEASKGIQQITIYDHIGKLIKTDNTNNVYTTQMDVRNLSSGIYIVKMVFEGSEPVVTKLFVK